jgi:hypothetical protein
MIPTITNTIENQTLEQKIARSPDFGINVLSCVNGIIYAHDARTGFLPTESKLVDVRAFMDKKIKGATGKIDEAVKIDPFFETYKNVLENTDALIKGATSSGNNVIQTGHELIRQVNTLVDVVGPQYQPYIYNASMVVNQKPVDKLSFVGFTKNGVVEGIPEISDNITPPPVTPAFTAYDKAIFADSIRWEFGQRELKDSAFSLESEMLKDIPSAMLKMKDDKITAIINAVASLGDISPDWDAYTGEHFTGDAVADIETDDNALNSLGGATHLIVPKDVIRLYKRNVQSGMLSVPSPSAEPSTSRSGQLPMNEHITYVVNNGLTANTYALIAKDSWADHFLGPTIQVDYQNKMSSGQLKGTILFDFNGVQVKLATALKKRNGLT